MRFHGFSLFKLTKIASILFFAFFQLSIAGPGGDADDRDRRDLTGHGTNAPGRFDSIHERHMAVQQNEINLSFFPFNYFHSLFAVRCLKKLRNMW